MIFYATIRNNIDVVYRYLGYWGRTCRRFVRPVAYENLFEARRYRRGAYLFGDIELLFGKRREKVRALHARLAESGAMTHCLNDPGKAMGRLALGQMLHSHKINAFRAMRCNEDLSGLRFPVFLRKVEGHLGPESGLLHDHATLEAGIRKFEARGAERGGTMVVEFVDTRDRSGLYRKYSAFNVDGAIIPRHVFFSRDWCQKSFDELGPGLLDEELAYMKDNPHREELKRIFRMAHIDYGRIDYGLLDGRIQVWEINTNPSICSERTDADPVRREVHRIFHEGFTAAMRELNRPTPWTWPAAYFRDFLRGVREIRRHEKAWRSIQRPDAAGASIEVRL